jgi:hypothetical protein
MAESRKLRDRPNQLLLLQAEMAGALLAVEQTQRETEAKIQAGAVSNVRLQDIQRTAGVAKLVARIIRCVADGIAWRTLHYDRAAIYLLSLKPQTGHLQPDSVRQELAAAASSVETSGRPAILNDLTNFLRYGDFTVLDGDTLEIVEVKGGKGAKKSGRAKRQERARTRILERLSTKAWKTDNGMERIFQHRVEPRSHFGEVRELVSEARVKGSARGRLSDCVAVEVWYLPTLMQVAEPEDGPKLMRNPFSQSAQALSYNPILFFNEFVRNLAPFSVYPLTDDDCVDLMTGTLQLTTHFNYGNLVRCLRRRGLKVTFPRESEFRAFNALTPDEKNRREDDVAIQVARPGRSHRLLIQLPLLGRVMYEFLDEESFADAIEELAEESASDSEATTYFAAFQEEACLWD